MIAVGIENGRIIPLEKMHTNSQDVIMNEKGIEN
jgi:hypothetical protein